MDRERHIRYATISKEALALRLEREAKAEEMRILYVAMTRAKWRSSSSSTARKGMEKKLRDLTAMTGIPVPPEAVADADSPGEWVLLSLLHTTQAAVLHGMAGVRPEVLTQAPDSWSIRLWHENGEASGTAVEDAEEAGVPQDFTEPDRAALDFVYPHVAVTTVPTKITATQLKGRELDQEVAGGAGTVRRPSEPEKPRFLQEIHGLVRRRAGYGHPSRDAVPADGHGGGGAVRGGSGTGAGAAAAIDARPRRRRWTSGPSRRFCGRRWRIASAAQSRYGGNTASPC